MRETGDPVDLGSLELRRIDGEHWIVQDVALAETDPRRVVACVHETEDDEVEVVWLHREVPLPTHYRQASDVIDDVARWSSTQTGMTRPIEIPHLPPIGG